MNSAEGRRRLRILMVGLSGGLCSFLMVTVLLVYGTPYNPVWWPIMGAILVASFVGPLFLVTPIEWVLKGFFGAGE
ncbi:MAG: hypothetical protein AAF495_11875 [Pseudomonadota bacterium]